MFPAPVVPLAPDLHLEPLNCTTISVRWQLAPRNSVGVQGYRLFYREESQSEGAPLLLQAAEFKRTIGGLGESCFSIVWTVECIFMCDIQIRAAAISIAKDAEAVKASWEVTCTLNVQRSRITPLYWSRKDELG